MDYGASEIIFRIISAYSVFSLFLQDEEGTRASSPASTSPPHQTQKIEKLRTYTGYVPTNSQTHELKPWVHISISGTRDSNQKEIWISRQITLTPTVWWTTSPFPMTANVVTFWPIVCRWSFCLHWWWWKMGREPVSAVLAGRTSVNCWMVICCRFPWFLTPSGWDGCSRCRASMRWD